MKPSAEMFIVLEFILLTEIMELQLLFLLSSLELSLSWFFLFLDASLCLDVYVGAALIPVGERYQIRF